MVTHIFHVDGMCFVCVVKCPKLIDDCVKVFHQTLHFQPSTGTFPLPMYCFTSVGSTATLGDMSHWKFGG